MQSAEAVPDPFNLARFLQAQEGGYDTVLEELRSGRKRTHWIWFIFPQWTGLGHSSMSRLYAIQTLDEARAYLAHPVLGALLRECAVAVLQAPAARIGEIFGFPDDLKVRSSVTLFAEISEPDSVFHQVLERFFSGAPDAETVRLMREG